MIKLENTKRGLGICIKGDYEDLNELYDAISQVSDLFFSTITESILDDYKKNKIDEKQKEEYLDSYESMHDCILGLCYDIRHAYQGDRKIEYINENKYYSVDVLYPWMIYYMMFFRILDEEEFCKRDFQLLPFPYNQIAYQRHKSILNYFNGEVWNCLIDFLGKTKTFTFYNVQEIYLCEIFAYINYFEAYCYYYCDINKSKSIRKSMLLTLLYECVNFRAKNNDYKQAVKKIEDTTHQKYLSLSKFNEDYMKIYRAKGIIYTTDFAELEMSYGDVDWDNLKY